MKLSRFATAMGCALALMLASSESDAKPAKRAKPAKKKPAKKPAKGANPTPAPDAPADTPETPDGETPDAPPPADKPSPLDKGLTKPSPLDKGLAKPSPLDKSTTPAPPGPGENGGKPAPINKGGTPAKPAPDKGGTPAKPAPPDKGGKPAKPAPLDTPATPAPPPEDTTSAPPEPPTVTASQVEIEAQAATLFQEGERHFQLREWEPAIAKFKQVYKLTGDPRALFAIGQAQQQKGDCVEAYAFYDTYRTTFPKGANIAQVKTLIGAVEPCATAGSKKASPPGKGIQLLSGANLEFYGMLRLDAHYTDSAMNDPRFTMWALSTENHTFVQGQDRIENNKNPTFVMHPRLSRFGMNATSKPIESIGKPALNGKLEFDFFAGENESRALPRLRHVYGQLAWTGVALLFGQTTDVISPLVPSVNAEAVMWNAGNLGDRQPQLQLQVRPALGSRMHANMQIAAGQEGARTNQDLDKDGILDGDLARRPQVQGRFGLELRHWLKEPIAFGAWVVQGAQRLVVLSALPIAVSDRTDFSTSAVGGDFSIPILKNLRLQGEVWQGRNLADLRGGIGQLIDTTSGTEIRSMGGWAELQLKLSAWRLSVGAGQDKPNADDVQLRGQRALNRVIWVGNLFTVGSFSLGLDYSRWHTEWVRLNTGVANRYSVSLVFSF